MGRRGSISFVIEVKRSRRRLPLALGRTDDPNGKGEVRLGAVRPSGFAAAPFSEAPKGYDPTVEAAKVAADKLFNRIRGPESAPVPAWTALGARRADEAPREQAAGMPVPSAPKDASTAQSPAANQVAQPRTGRVLESLTSVNPLEALFRQKAEEQAPRPRRPRAPRVATPGEPQSAVRPNSKQGSTSKSATDAKTTLETVVDPTDPKQPRRSRNTSRRKTAERRFAKELRGKARRKRKTAAKRRRQAARPMRTAKPVAGPKRNTRNRPKVSAGKKRSAPKTAARKVAARKPAPHKAATRKSAARKAAKVSKRRKTGTKSFASRRRASTRGRRGR
jgi:hypothetical protein